MTDYEKVYQRCGNACGQPFDEFVAFFDAAETELSVLDLGCGQGRDSLMAARRGHHVHAVDLAPTGIAQVIARAKAEELDIRGEVADVEDFEADREYDVVILDRVLHMLRSDARRIALLDKARRWVRAGGHVLVADTRSHRDLISCYFSAVGWKPVLEKKKFLFVRRPRHLAVQQADATDLRPAADRQAVRRRHSPSPRLTRGNALVPLARWARATPSADQDPRDAQSVPRTPAHSSE